MPNTLTNTFLDALGATKAVLYRVFWAREWSPPQPMFNVLHVQEGKSETFEAFLARAQIISNKIHTPISLGPYKTESRTYIYVTHYASTWSFIRVMTRLTLTLTALKRAAATEHTSWTYCHPTNSPGLVDLKQVLVVGISGETSDFLAFLGEREIGTAAVVERVKDVRGTSLDTYFVLADTTDSEAALEGFPRGDNELVVYRAATLPA